MELIGKEYTHIFMRYKDFQSDCTPGSLMHRWSVIQFAVNKFQGFYNQVGVRSGNSEDEKVYIHNLVK